MAEQTTKAPESQSAPATTQSDTTTTQDTATQTLEDVYKQFNVEPVQQSQPQPQPNQPGPQQQPPQQDDPIPDAALDPKGFEAWARKQGQSQAQIRQTLQAVVGRLHALSAADVRQREEADIKSAVGAIKDKLPDFDDDFLEIAIAQKARTDEKFMALWQNRGKNPQAWNAGVKALGNSLGSKFAMRADPQLAENLRAAKSSQQSMATAAPEESEIERLGKLNGNDFDNALNKFRARA